MSCYNCGSEMVECDSLNQNTLEIQDAWFECTKCGATKKVDTRLIRTRW